MGWRRLLSIALVLVCVALSLAGSYVTVRAFGSSVGQFALGTVRVGVTPALSGRVDLYVPIVDWGVRASPYEAPVAIEVRFRSLDREAALASLRSGGPGRRELREMRSDLAEIGRHALVRAALLGLGGGIAGGIIAGALIGAVLRRRRWLGYGAAVGVVVPLIAVVVSYFSLREIDYAAFEEPTFYAHGAELPRLLSLSEQLATASERYAQAYEQALAGLSNVIAFAGEAQAPAGSSGRTALVASDLHANALILPVLAEYARGKTVFLVGDHTLFGSEIESGLAPGIRVLSTRVVAVSGNHDSRPFMLELARAGVIVLTRYGRLLPDGSYDGERVAEIDGLAVAGYDDPLENPSGEVRARSLELTDEELERETRDFITWFETLPERPDVVLVHQNKLARALLDVLGERPGPPVAIFTGHDHTQHLEQAGPAVLIDGGTVGAGGPWEIGEQAAGFAAVHFTQQDTVDTVDLIEIEPLSGNARATREVIQQPTQAGLAFPGSNQE